MTAAKDTPFWESFGEWVLGVPLQIVIILLSAVIAELLLNWLIRRVVRRTVDKARIERLAQTRKITRTAELSEALLTQRTEQRASAIGTLLRSVVAITVWAIAVLMILPLLGMDIAPLLASAGVVGVVRSELFGEKGVSPGGLDLDQGGEIQGVHQREPGKVDLG